METIGLDLHKRESHLAIQAEDGITERRIVTGRERFTVVDFAGFGWTLVPTAA